MHIKSLSLALMLSSCAPAYASGIGIPEYRQWTMCDKQSVAESIAELARTDGWEAGFWAWNNAEKYGLCRVGYAAMFPQAVVWREKSLVDNSTIRVVRIADEDNKLYFWLTLEPVVGEPVQ